MKNFFKTLCLSIVLLICFSTFVNANRLVLSNQSQSGAVPGTTFTVNFKIEWDNSWNLFGTGTQPLNWDAIWVFIKYKDCDPTNLVWNHATVDAAGHVAPAGLQIDVPADRMGVFIRRSASSVQANIPTTATNVSINVTVPIVGSYDFQVFGIEMVYVPQGDFLVGDAANSPSAAPTWGFVESLITTTQESAGMTAAAIGGNAPAAVPIAYPVGWNAFYCMKYEITNEQYVAFLNTLTYNQQATRTGIAPNSAANTTALYFCCPWTSPGIYIKTPGISATNPAVFGCNANVNGVWDEALDGQNVALNSISWADLTAYLDWAALRPMSDLEFEKACRGSGPRVGGEYAGGKISILAATGPTNPYAVNEISTATGDGLINYNSTIGRPLRAGFGAVAGNTRLKSGTSFYGICDLSGNVWERVVSVGNATGLAFDATLGNGVLAANGDHDVATWPTAAAATGSGYRGGAYNTINSTCRVSDRSSGNTISAARAHGQGGRGVRQN